MCDMCKGWLWIDEGPSANGPWKSDKGYQADTRQEATTALKTDLDLTASKDFANAVMDAWNSTAFPLGFSTETTNGEVTTIIVRNGRSDSWCRFQYVAK